MVLSITAALITAGVLGLWFASTRILSLTAVAVLVFIFPWLVALILIGSVAGFYFFRVRK